MHDISNRPSAQETSVTNKPSEPPVKKEYGRKDEENVICLNANGQQKVVVHTVRQDRIGSTIFAIN